ncbi:MAG: 50S ribosomal protein L31e [Candidatus Bathyarchaeota archaeon]|nr:50S ribosomal protein L31e [Candidatus Bathyarchaeota archaeon]
MEEEKEKEEQKTGEEPKESVETVEEAKAEVEEETEEVLEKEEVPEKEEEALEGEAVEAKGEEMTAPVGEEAKPPPREEKEVEEEIVEERVYTIPLGKSWIMPPNKRAPRAMRMIRSFVVKHMKLEVRKGEGEEEEEPKRLVISGEVNEKVWMRGIEKPPRKIRIRAAKDKEGNVTVYLAEGD